MKQSILLVSPPFTQLNTPYPATAYLKGFLNTQAVISHQLDLGIETILKLFSKSGLEQLFAAASEKVNDGSPNSQRIYAMRESYIHTIEPVISYLQDDDPTLSHFISSRHFLPEASKFEQLEDFDWAFGTMGIRDKARHIATLYLEDLSDFILDVVDPHFGFSRYAERLGMSAHSFDDLYEEINASSTYIAQLMLSILEERIKEYNPTIICLSVPFPGNLFAAFKCGQWLKQNHPAIKIVMGGGYPNTELRSISDVRPFEFVDFICLDDGETPLMQLLSYLDRKIDVTMLKRTFTVLNCVVTYCNGSLHPDIKQENVGTPDYAELPLKKYLSVIQLPNPMHRLWSDGRWNKLTMAHGCYWGKCTFCDISLDYIKNYEASSAVLIVDRMETLVEQTGECGFHFVDEAAPPALMKAVALEILKRKLVVSWWTNIRFEKSFHYDLCRVLAASGCIAISGGLEVASDRLLQLIAKGVTVEQVSVVTQNFNRAGIMVHAYLMYGFPTQTAQETIDSLEVVRQMFDTGIMQSAFWHRFAMTAHSPVGLYPDQFKVKTITQGVGTFANNDLEHDDPTGADHDLFAAGLRKSLYNFMHGIGLDHPLQNWFDHNVPDSSLANDLIAKYLARPDGREMKASHMIIWIGGPVRYDSKHKVLKISTKQEEIEIECPTAEGQWLESVLDKMSAKNNSPFTYQQLKEDYDRTDLNDFTLYWYGRVMEELKEIGLLVL
ncbi:MAG: radical SAM protein [Saprospiraceae bacterium]|uniref:Radical SAM protein n=1 Tax=Candidatus Opimibacter skivensis TaxID=2982028 RepID=A0A9D7SSJ0_9BACT|nr:radical SAM protein [Candidatus Opimibacter skivensis]